MKLLRISLASLVACALLAAPGHAATGNGLYEPFPSPSAASTSVRFVDALPGGAGFTDLNVLDLGRGVLVGREAVTAAATPRAPDARAQAGTGFAPSIGWPAALALLAAVLGGAGLLAARRA